MLWTGQDFLFAGLYKKFRFRAPNKKNIARQVFLKNHPKKNATLSRIFGMARARAQNDV
jgi:hypothetical protein